MYRLLMLLFIFLHITCNDMSKVYSQLVFKIVPPEVAAICSIPVGESFQIKFEFSTQESKVPTHEFIPPIFSGLTVIEGPEKGVFSSTTVANGNETHRNGCAYTYTLKALEKGTYIIPIASLRVNDEELKSDPVSIHVVPPLTSNKIDNKIEFNVYAPDSVEVDTHFKVNFEINVKTGKNFQAPTFDGFEVLSVPTENTSESKIQKDGITESMVVCQYSFILKSSQKGRFAIPPASVTVNGIVYKTKEAKITIL